MMGNTHALREALYLRAIELIMNHGAPPDRVLDLAAYQLGIIPDRVLADAHTELDALIDAHIIKDGELPAPRQFPILLATAINQTPTVKAALPPPPKAAQYIASAIKLATELPDTPIRTLLLQDLTNAQTALKGTAHACLPVSSMTTTN